MELSYELLHDAYRQAENMMDVEGRAACIASMIKRLQITENTHEREQLEQFLHTHFKVVFLAAMEKIYAHDGKIAEYYCHASKDVQRLMEESALIIIDFKDAIGGGMCDCEMILGR